MTERSRAYPDDDCSWATVPVALVGMLFVLRAYDVRSKYE